MRTALKPGARVRVNGVDFEIVSLLSASGGASLIYQARQLVGAEGYAGRTVIKEFFPALGAVRDEQGRVCCASEDPEERRRFEALRRGMVDEGFVGDEARSACSQVYAFEHASDGYAVMREFSRDTRSLAEVLDAWQNAPPTSDEEYADMARLRYALRIAHSLLTGLRTIHESAGILHRDISLGNVVWAASELAADGRDGRAYFLDFGSALRMNGRGEAQNTADPLSLFATYSFAAPEIWQLGGTLTPAVDLFSISAILLVLCCGKKCCIRMKPGWHLASQTNVGRLYESDFVVRSAVQKLNIPAELRGMLFDFLLEGLSKSPDARFGRSPAKMLEALERLQAKCAPRQRLREYVAFISYHHRPLDLAVARRLHRLIERYHVPAELAGEGGARRLGMVFRDEDELPVSTDLTDNIQEALDHSEYLIVVCTPGTPKSIWVEAEIAYFLRHHDRNHVLAVLAEGRPEESFPPHLRRLYDAEGNEVGETEYLAANIAGKTERETLRNLNQGKLRLIAAMLGCPYDALVQREKRYRMQRVAMGAGVATLVLIAFVSMLLVKNREISDKNQQLDLQYRATLLNESHALSRAAQLELQQGNAMGALEYALDAVPTSENERPYTALAEQVLNDLLAPYAFGNSGLVSIIEQQTKIVAMAVNRDDTAVFTLDEYGNAQARDISGGAPLWAYGIPVSAYDEHLSLTAINELDALLVHSSEQTCLIDAAGGEMLWSRDTRRATIQLSEDRKTLAVFDDFYPGVGEDCDGFKGIRFLSMSDGSVIRDVDCDSLLISGSVMDLQYYDGQMACEGTFADADRLFGVSFNADAYERHTGEMLVYAIEAGQPRILARRVFDLGNAGLFDDLPHPVALRYYESDRSLLIASLDGAGQSLRLEKISVGNGDVLYERDFSRQAVEYPRKMCFMSTESHAFFTLDNDLYCFDVDSGELLARSLDNSSEFISFIPLPDCGNGGLLVNGNESYCAFACLDGQINYSNFDHQRLRLGAVGMVVQGNAPCLVQAAGGGNFAMGYVVDMNPDGIVAVRPEAYPNRVMVYRPRVARERYLKDLAVDRSEYLLDRTGRFLMDRGVGLYDMEHETRVELPGWHALSNYDDLVVSLDRETITCLGEERVGVYTLEGEPLSELSLPELSEDYFHFCDIAAMALRPDGSPLVALFDDHALYCYVDGQREEVPLPADALPGYDAELRPLFDYSFRVLTDGRYVVIASGEEDGAGQCLVYDIDEKAWRRLSGGAWALSPSYCERALCLGERGGILAWPSVDGELLFYDLVSCALIQSVPLATPAEGIQDMRFIDGDRMLACLEGDRLTACDVQSGDLRTCDYRHNYKHVSMMTDLANICEDARLRRLYVGDPAGGGEGICLDIDSWTRIASVPYLIGYSPSDNRLQIYDFPAYWHPNEIGHPDFKYIPEGACGICAVPALDLAALSAMGREILHGIHAHGGEAGD